MNGQPQPAANVVEIAEARRASAEAHDWADFASASHLAAATGDQALVAFCGSWLALAARQLPRAEQALLLLAEHEGQPYRPVAAWPDPRRDLSAMGPLAQQALRERRGQAIDLAADGPPRPGLPVRLAFPILPAADAQAAQDPGAEAPAPRPLGVVVLDLADGAALRVQQGLRTLHWSSGWLLAHLQARRDALQQQRLRDAQQLNELSALALQQPKLEASALAVANQLATWFGCSRVAVGLEQRERIRLIALSHGGHFDPRTDTLRTLAEAMTEALDLGRPVACDRGGAQGRAQAPGGGAGGGTPGGRAGSGMPGGTAGGTRGTAPGSTSGSAPPPDPAAAAARAPVNASSASSSAYPNPPASPSMAEAGEGSLILSGAARRLGVAALACVPLSPGPVAIGALSLERPDGPAFSPQELDRLHHLAAWLAPMWALQQARERPLGQQLRDRLAAQAPAWRRPGRVMVAGLSALALLAAALWPMPHRISARGTLEGLSQRAVLAPFDGHLAEVLVQPGDRVRAGQPLARLDARDLQLELARWQADHEQQQRRQQYAMAQGDRAALGVAQAQLAQSEAQLGLARERLARATLSAPLDAVVTQGDWRTQLGAAVERGRVLFELAPPTGHRVVLKVDDTDIARLAPGQRGELVLAGLPQQAWPFTVATVMPVATAVEGRQVFRVEALLAGDAARDARLRPGMEGIGKVEVGERSALWIATHRMIDALRIAFWGWMP